MVVDVLTLFPELVESSLGYSIPQRAQKAGILKLRVHQWRQWAVDRHGTVDASPYGGGPGMILRVDVVHAALKEIDYQHKAHRILLAPDGWQLDHSVAKQLSTQKRLVLLCGRYEGFDKRVEKYIDDKLSIGPYVLSGGELASAVVIDVVTRLLPGALGNPASIEEETFTKDRAEYPQYTRPENYRGDKVPSVLLSGDHAKIKAWRQKHSRQLK